MEDLIEIYADGSYRRHTGKGAFATYMTWNGMSVLVYAPTAFTDTSINRMELLGVICGLEKLNRRCRVKVYSDSQYTVNSINGWVWGWLRNNWITATGKPVANRDLMERIIAQHRIHKITAEWVPGHKGIWQNELCNEIAQGLTL